MNNKTVSYVAFDRYSRLIVVVAIMLIVASLIYAYPAGLGASSNVTRFEDKPWRQPDQINDEFPENITVTQWDFEFAPIEERLAQLTFEPSGELVPNAVNQRVLRELTLWSFSEIEPADSVRIEQLVRKSLPSDQSQALLAAWDSYKRYLPAELIVNALPEAMLTALTRLQLKETIQIDVFGAVTADDLFGDSNRLSMYLIKRRLVRQNSMLSVEEKEAELASIEQDYRSQNRLQASNQSQSQSQTK